MINSITLKTNINNNSFTWRPSTNNNLRDNINNNLRDNINNNLRANISNNLITLKTSTNKNSNPNHNSITL